MQGLFTDLLSGRGMTKLRNGFTFNQGTELLSRVVLTNDDSMSGQRKEIGAFVSHRTSDV